MKLARDLGKTLEEIQNISIKEFQYWMALYELEYEEHQKELDKARSNSQPSKPRARRR